MDSRYEFVLKASQDPAVSLDALGLLVRLYTDPAVATLAADPEKLGRLVGLGRTKSYRLLRELTDAGYIVRYQPQSNGRFNEMVIHFPFDKK